MSVTDEHVRQWRDGFCTGSRDTKTVTRVVLPQVSKSLCPKPHVSPGTPQLSWKAPKDVSPRTPHLSSPK
eukprot:5965341-Amphidinium_carterae.1